MKRHPRSFWVKLAAEVDAGSPFDAVAGRHGVNPVTLKWWTYQLRAQARSASSPSFLPVVVRDEPARATGLVEVLVGDVVVRVATGTDPRYVAALAGALREC